MIGATLIRRVRGGMVAGILTTKTPAAAAGSRSMSIWSDMPMGPPDPILGLTGQSRAGAFVLSSYEYSIYFFVVKCFTNMSAV